MHQEELTRLVEAVLFVSVKPLTVKALWEKLFDQPAELEAEEDTGTVTKQAVAEVLERLQEHYHGRGVELHQVASGYRFQAVADLAPYINRMRPEKPPKYSRAVLETLAIICYQQPVTRAEIEDIRGVSVSASIVKLLQERNWIRVVGHKDVPGKPALLATTKGFLDYFNISSLEGLPALAALKEMDAAQLEAAIADELSDPVAKTEDAQGAGILEPVSSDSTADQPECSEMA